MNSQRAPHDRAFNESRRHSSSPGPVVDAFVLPSAAVRPGLFFHVKRLCVWLLWLALAAAAGVVMKYPRQSLITALTGVKMVIDSYHDAFDPPKPKSPGPEPAGKERTQGTMAQNGKSGPGQSPAGTGEAKGAVGTTDKLQNTKGAGSARSAGTRSAVATTSQGGPGTGGPLEINTPTGSGQPNTPRLALNLVIPGGGSGQQGPAAMPVQPGPVPTSIIINNNGSGAGNGQPEPPAVTISQVGGPAGGPAIAPVETGTNQPPPTVIVNGQPLKPGTVAIRGLRSSGGPEDTVLRPGETAAVSGENAVGSAGFRNMTANPNNLRPDWPKTVAIRGTPTVTCLERGSGSHRQFAAQTDHYEFQSDLQVGADVVRELSRVFEATYELNKLLPLGIHPSPEQDRPRFVARLFSKDRDYLAAGGLPGSSGTYSRDQACILVPVSSMGVKLVNGRMQTERTESTETLIHEITHQMMNQWLPLLPRWYAEGSADYVAMADYLHGRFFLNQMEDRLRLYLRHRGQRDETFYMLRPGDLMTLDAKTWSETLASNAAGASQNYASATLLTYYFYHLDGNGDGAGVLAYLGALKKGMAEPEAAATHLLRNRTMDELEGNVVNAFEEHNIKIATVSHAGVARK